MKPTPSDYRPGPHRIAILAAALCWPLLLSGGQVTTYRVGMAVPDWPTTFGINLFLYDMWNASWAVFIEHRHRLFGSALGFATIGLAAWFGLADRRRWMKALGGIALLAVVAQGLLGGARVLRNSTEMAAVHGCSAQAVFALLVALCVFSGRGWAAAGEPRPDAGHFRRRSAVTLLLIYAQIVAGALLRHYGAGLVIHALLAAAVWGHVAALAWRVERRKVEVPELVPAARAMAAFASIQILLGVAAWWLLRPFDGVPRPVTIPQALIRTGHLGNGALLLASAVVLTLRAARVLAPAPIVFLESPATRELEAVG